MVIETLPRRERFLDIGAGGGHLTIPIAQQFEMTTIVEPNPRQAEIFRHRCPYFRIYNDYWKDIDLGDELFDLILCSHILYPEGSWMQTVKRCTATFHRAGVLLS